MEKSQAPAIILVIAVGLIIIIALSVMVIRGIKGYGNALDRFENPEGAWPKERWQPPKKRYQDVPPADAPIWHAPPRPAPAAPGS